MRICPRCAFPLDVVTRDGTQLDHCRRCRGTFLDPGEETQMLGMVVSPAVWAQSSVTEDLGLSSLKCPEDGTPFTTYAVAFGKQSVEVDVCHECSGMWFDAGEGRKLRDIVMEAGQSPETDFVAVSDRPGVHAYLFQLFSGFPMEVWNPRWKYPVCTITLVSTLYIVFALQVFSLFAGGMGRSQELVELFGLVPTQVLSGKHLWSLVTHMFLHSGILHILGNSYFLYVFGDNVEDVIGKRHFLFLYFTSGITGAIFQMLSQTRSAIPMIGASGAVAGLLGAYLILFPRVKLYVVMFFARLRLGVTWYLGLWVAFNVLMALAGAQKVAWMAHIGGFIAGALIAFRYRVKPLIQQLQE